MMEPGTFVAGHRVERLLGDNSLAGTWLVSASDGSPAIARVLLFLAPAYQERFRRSAEALRVAAHPHLVRVLGVIEVEGFAGAILEYVEGEDLTAWIARGPHPPQAIVGMIYGILSGVSAAHELGLLHRNLKPTRVRLDRDGSPKVDDFALGKVTVTQEDDPQLTQLGTTFGTPQYMAPEQFRGAALVDHQADLFSVGCIAYELCTGRRAFDGADVGKLYGAIRRGQYAPIPSLRADLPAGLVQLVDDLMRPDPAERPDTALAAIERLKSDPELAALLPSTRTLRTSVIGVPAEYGTPAAIGPRTTDPQIEPEEERPKGRRVTRDRASIPYVLIALAIATLVGVVYAAWWALHTTPPPVVGG